MFENKLSALFDALLFNSINILWKYKVYQRNVLRVTLNANKIDIKVRENNKLNVRSRMFYLTGSNKSKYLINTDLVTNGSLYNSLIFYNYKLS